MSRQGKFRGGRLLLPALAVAGAGLAVAGLRRSAQRPGSPFLAGGPLLIAHRGGAALAPENTLLAFERALSWWQADVLELDVQPTRDGEAAVIHDASLDRTTDASGLVIERSMAQIRELDAGYRFTPDDGATYPFRGRGLRVPTLTEVLSAFPQARIIIEIKDGRVQRRVKEAITQARAHHRVLVAAGRTRDRLEFRGFPVATSAGEEELRLFLAQLRVRALLHVPAVDAFQVPDHHAGREIPTPPFIEASRARNIPVHVWTVNETKDMSRYLERGVDGIVTDRPDRLARLLHERNGRPLPAGPPHAVPEPFLEALLGE